MADRELQVKKKRYYAAVFAVYFTAALLWTFAANYNFDADVMSYRVKSNGENLLDALIFFSPFIVLLLGEFAAFLIGRKLFGKWGAKNALLTAGVSLLGLIAGGLTIAMILGIKFF